MHKPSLLVAPASLLANWAAEIDALRAEPKGGRGPSVVHCRPSN